MQVSKLSSGVLMDGFLLCHPLQIILSGSLKFFYNRLLSASLHSGEVDSWVKIIDSRDVLQRVMWIAANTMNVQLLEKVFIFVAAAIKGVIHCPFIYSNLSLFIVELLEKLSAEGICSKSGTFTFSFFNACASLINLDLGFMVYKVSIRAEC